MSALSVEMRGSVALLTLNVPDDAVNRVDRAVREEMDRRLDDLAADPNVGAVVLRSGKPGAFMASADIREFLALRSRQEGQRLAREGQALVGRLERLGKPVVAAVHGTCLGGGLEAALACSYRVASDHPSTRLGLPEIKLGIIPATGGCQRLPRLVGARAALDLILSGRQISAAAARRIGLVDEVVHPAVLDRVAVATAHRLGEGRASRRRGIAAAGRAVDRSALGRRMVFPAARKRVLRRTGGHYPAPLAALQAVEHGLHHGVEAGLDMEAALFAELAVGEVSRNLVRIFFQTTALKKEPSIEGKMPEPRAVERMAVVGAGFMGAAVSGVAVLEAGTDVRLRDTDLKAVGRGVAAARESLNEARRKQRITASEHRRLERLVSGGVTWDGFPRADLVLEAVYEDLEIKHEVMRDIERQVRDDCIIASNTSTIPIARIAAALERPDRLLGMHFFSPADRMPLLEIIATDRTADWVVVSAVAFGRRLGKTVIVVRDQPGFWVNRILAPYLNEAVLLVQEGVDVGQLEVAMTSFGFPVGPITLLDEIGWDVAAKAAGVLHEVFGNHMRPADGMARMTEEGRLGRKTGRGFFRYEHGRKMDVDQSVYEVVGAVPDSIIPREDVTSRLVYVMLNEAARAMGDGVVRTPRDGDVGAVLGLGFPAFRGGPLRYLDAVGADTVVAALTQLASRYGDRFEPCPTLRDMARTGERFHPND